MANSVRHRSWISRTRLGRPSAALAFVIVLALGVASASVAQAQTFTRLYNFTGSTGAYPKAGVIEDESGNLYGTTNSGGSSSYYGSVFQVSSSGAETVLYNFTGSKDGAYPFAPIIRDSQGTLYGTTEGGGASGQGTVFMLNTAGRETVLHSFVGRRRDGCHPQGGLAIDNHGNLYGTTVDCGAHNRGTVFKLSKKGTFTLLHSFAGGSSDGARPNFTRPIVDQNGDIYGVTQYGGQAGTGVVYRLTKKRITVLHSFAGGMKDGCYPIGTPAMDTAGGLYGTTEGCGAFSQGTVWKVSQKGAETILHSFAGGPADGCQPWGGPVRDSEGNLYGNTEGCGTSIYGTVWKLSGGTLTLLHSFDGSSGEYPVGDLLRDSKGGLYGTTTQGGNFDFGTVWKLTP